MNSRVDDERQRTKLSGKCYVRAFLDSAATATSHGSVMAFSLLNGQANVPGNAVWFHLSSKRVILPCASVCMTTVLCITLTVPSALSLYLCFWTYSICVGSSRMSFHSSVSDSLNTARIAYHCARYCLAPTAWQIGSLNVALRLHERAKIAADGFAENRSMASLTRLNVVCDGSSVGYDSNASNAADCGATSVVIFQVMRAPGWPIRKWRCDAPICDVDADTKRALQSASRPRVPTTRVPVLLQPRPVCTLACAVELNDIAHSTTNSVCVNDAVSLLARVEKRTPSSTGQSRIDVGRRRGRAHCWTIQVRDRSETWT